jgi:hypothetical protein
MNRTLFIDAKMSLVLCAVLMLAACGGGGGYVVNANLNGTFKIVRYSFSPNNGDVGDLVSVTFDGAGNFNGIDVHDGGRQRLSAETVDIPRALRRRCVSRRAETSLDQWGSIAQSL